MLSTRFAFASMRRARALGLRYRASALLLVLNLAAVVFEGIGIAMLLPIFEFLEKGGDLSKLAQAGRHWALLVDLSRHWGVQINLAVLLAISFSAILGRQLFTYLHTRYKQKLYFDSVHALRKRIFILSLRASTSLQQEASLGVTVNDLVLELPKGMNALYGTVSFISRLLLILIYSASLLWLTPSMSIIALCVIVVVGIGFSGYIRQIGNVSKAIVNANRRFSAFLVERIQALRLIRLSSTEVAEIKNFDRLSLEQRDYEVHMRGLVARLESVIEPTAIFIAFMVLYIGYSYFNMPLGSLALFIIVIVRLLPLLKDVAGVYQSIHSQWQSLAVIEQRIGLLSAHREPKGGEQKFGSFQIGITYDAVTYSYPGSAPALRSISCKLPAGKMTALVGPSGSGKSTFIDLLPRLRDPSSGVIYVDDVPLDRFSISSLRESIAFVPQTPQLFNVTAAEHIRYGRLGASDAEVTVAARLSGAAEFIERLPNGYATLLGDNANKLSGGQRQRLDIARALLRRSPILILDEPSSQLDAESEQALRSAMARIRKETSTTVIVVAHRFSTVIEADQILVFQDGAIAESGSHAELIGKAGWYSTAFKSQDFAD